MMAAAWIIWCDHTWNLIPWFCNLIFQEPYFSASWAKRLLFRCILFRSNLPVIQHKISSIMGDPAVRDRGIPDLNESNWSAWQDELFKEAMKYGDARKIIILRASKQLWSDATSHGLYWIELRSEAQVSESGRTYGSWWQQRTYGWLLLIWRHVYSYDQGPIPRLFVSLWISLY